MRKGIPGYVYLLGFLLFGVALAPVQAQTGGSDLSIYAGVSYYPNPSYDSLVPVEFSFTLNRSDFEFFKPDSADNRYYARIFAEVKLLGDDGFPVDSAKTYFSSSVADTAEASKSGYRLFNNLVLRARPGHYTARLTVIDAVSKKEGSVFYDYVNVPHINRENLSIGGTSVAYAVSRVDTSAAGYDNLVKNGFRVLTNPLAVFSTEDTVMYIYGEIYHLAYDSARGSKYQLAYRVDTEFGEEFRNFGYTFVDKPGKSAAVIQSFDISGWPAGNYNLVMAVTDTVSHEDATATIPFKIVSPTRILAAMTTRGTFDPYDTLDLQAKENLVAYMLTPAEKQVFSGLSPDGKLNYLSQYWREHDSDPTTERIENRNEMIERYQYVNRVYSTNVAGTNGWSTDRGRIYMTYGPPEKHEDFPSPLSGNPYSVWWYFSKREGSVFVFEDKYGYDDYLLVHSNVEGERFDKIWDQRLKQDYSGSY